MDGWGELYSFLCFFLEFFNFAKPLISRTCLEQSYHDNSKNDQKEFK